MQSLPDSAAFIGDVVEINFIDVRNDGLIIEEDVSSVASVVCVRFKVI